MQLGYLLDLQENKQFGIALSKIEKEVSKGK